MKPLSSSSLICLAPRANAFSESSRTCSVEVHANDKIASVVSAGAIGFGMNPWKTSRSSSITKMWSLTIMQVDWSLVNFGLNVKPIPVKNSTLRFRLATGRFTKI